ncbi:MULTISPECIES: hypothetical protein [Rothia]|uniref:Uncharacterized protein n=1 Tax=Rothia kristinae TaxID=37923 RepID=A0A7T3CHV7_9MICC|nr:hypothetical protein [Rothia kristinae]MCA1170326.1 hypothetical protein [Rothia kristinae]MCT1356764.1 hypothetical protein [Rothia kristinae]MCT1393739.1 hypothetical protein [Rothia kristinae]MCT1504981.1 hypothetical protein [Rothia kristinae]MCT2037854.1 hypothetical protein [Rothia kristinae]
MSAAPPPQDPQPTQQPPRRPDRPLGEDERARAAESLLYRSRAGLLLAVIGFCLSTFAGRSWGGWALAGAGLAFLGAAVACIMTLVALKRVGARPFSYVLTSLSLALVLWFAVSMAANLLLWGAAEDYRECVRTSLTISSSGQCQERLTDGIERTLTGR